MLNSTQDASQGLVGTAAGDKVAIQSAPPSANPQDIGDGLGKMIISAPGSPSEPVSSTSEKSDTAKVSNASKLFPAPSVAPPMGRYHFNDCYAFHAVIAAANDHQPNDCPARADLRTEIYRPLPVVSLPVDASSPDPSDICAEVLQALFEGLSEGNVNKVKNCFYDEQCYWRDQLALTYHFRTFKDKECISKALVERAAISKPGSVAVAPGTARLTSAGPTLVRRGLTD